METREQTIQRYWAALDKVTAQLEADYYVLAAVLYGSLARGEPWEKSDIDLMIVLRDDPQNRAPELVWMSADGINVYAEYLINNPGETNSRRRHLPKMPNTGTLRNLC